MKLYVMDIRLSTPPLYEQEGLFIYHITDREYKKLILKGIYPITCYYNTARICFVYAITVLEGRFELGEEYISKSDCHSYYYATEITHNRFLLGERTIKKSGYRKEYETYFNITL